MPADLAEVYAEIGIGTMIAPHFGRLMSPSECKARKSLMDGVDKRGRWFATTWMPFTEDAGGGTLCFDTKSARLVYVDAPTSGEPPKILASTVAAWRAATTRALAKVPDPPDPDEDDYLEDEQEQRFDEILRTELLKKAKLAPKPKPRTDIPPAAPLPDTSFLKHHELFATFKPTKKHALDGLWVGRGIGESEGKCRLKGIGAVGYPGKWPKSMWRLLFYWDHSETSQGQAAIVLLDAKRLEAIVTVDDSWEADACVKAVDRILARLGFVFDVIDDPKHRARVAKRFQRYVDGA